MEISSDFSQNKQTKVVSSIFFIVCCIAVAVGFSFLYITLIDTKDRVVVMSTQVTTPVSSTEAGFISAEYVPSTTIKASDVKSISDTEAMGLFTTIMNNHTLDKIVTTKNPSISVVGINRSKNLDQQNISLWAMDTDENEEYHIKDFSSTRACSSLEWDYFPNEDVIQARHFESPCEAGQAETLYIFGSTGFRSERLKVSNTGDGVNLSITRQTPTQVSLIFDKNCVDLEYEILDDEGKEENFPKINWTGVSVKSERRDLSNKEKIFNLTSSIPVSCGAGYGYSKQNPFIDGIKYANNQLMFNFKKYTIKIDLEKFTKIFEMEGPYGISIDDAVLK